MYSVLDNEDFNTSEIYGVINALEKHVSARRVRPGHKYIIEKSTSNVLISFSYFPTKIDMYKVSASTTGAYTANYEKEEMQKDLIVISGTIDSSLYEVMITHENGSPLLAVEFADIFAWQIDFFTEPRHGDEFKLVYEHYTSKRGYTKIGRILAAIYKNKQKSFKAVFFDNGNGKSGYYDEKGHSMQKAFLRAPLNYRRISSFFSHRRFHPILKYHRPHRGIDYAAPRGTPIVAVGDGKVIASKWSGGFGRLIKIRHNSIYETWYGHLSRYAKGVRTGKYVKQGQVIGYVGSSGLSTGPHLDFRIKKNNRFVNYIRLKFPPAKSIPKKYFSNFAETRDELLAKINEPAV
ncbi:peptidoglycan DD-metalloendopeptidase family protein [bacterium]